jgi:periplasmic protein CpxP/Spy
MKSAMARATMLSQRMQWMQWMMTAMLLAALVAFSLPARAQPAPPPPPGMGDRGHGMGDRGPGMGPMQGGMHHGMHDRMGGGMMFGGSPERMSRMIDRMLDGVSASDAQRSQVKQIAIAAAADLKAQAQAGRGLRQRGMQALMAPTVDANAVEQVRQQMLQQHDQMSRRMTQAMLDIARVLTPEQRAKLGERMRDRQARMEDRMQRMQHMREQPHR